MPMLAAVVLAPLLLEHDDLGAARLLHDLRAYRGARHDRGPNLGIFPAQRQDLVKCDFRADFTLNSLDGDLVTDTDAILLSACFYDGKHGITRNELIIGPPRACQRDPVASLFLICHYRV